MDNPPAYSDEFTALLAEGDPTTAIYVSKDITVDEISDKAYKSVFRHIKEAMKLVEETTKDQTLVLTFPPNKTTISLFNSAILFLMHHPATVGVQDLPIHPDADATRKRIIATTATFSSLTIIFVGLCINVYPQNVPDRDFDEESSSEDGEGEYDEDDEESGSEDEEGPDDEESGSEDGEDEEPQSSSDDE